MFILKCFLTHFIKEAKTIADILSYFPSSSFDFLSPYSSLLLIHKHLLIHFVETFSWNVNNRTIFVSHFQEEQCLSNDNNSGLSDLKVMSPSLG